MLGSQSWMCAPGRSHALLSQVGTNGPWVSQIQLPPTSILSPSPLQLRGELSHAAKHTQEMWQEM